MGLREVSLVLLVSGAVLGIDGGLGICCYKGRFANVNIDYLKQWGGLTVKPVVQCALASCIFGIFRAAVCITVFVLLIIGFNRLIVSILFLVSAVLYLGELIPEAILLWKCQYGWSPDYQESLQLNGRPLSHECDPSSEFVKWAENYQMEVAQAKASYLGNQPDDPTKTAHIQNVDRAAGYLPDAFNSGQCYLWGTGDAGWGLRYKTNLAVFDYAKSKAPAQMSTQADCDSIDLVVLKHKGGWTSGACTSAAKKACKEDFGDPPSLEGDPKKARSDYYAKQYRTGWNSQIETSTEGLYTCNSLFLGVQTFAVVMTVVGVILSGVSGGGKSDPDP